MYKMLADTCIWESLAKEPEQRSLLNVLFELEACGELRLIVPRVVLDEFERSRDRITKENTRSVSSTLKRIKDIVEKHGDGDGKAVALRQLNLVDSKLPRLGDAAETIVANIEGLFQRAEILEATSGIMIRAARRALERKAPFIAKRNIADAIIIETFRECVASDSGHQFAFVTSNVNDFSDRARNDRNPHPDIADIFAKPSVRYFIKLTDALHWVSPDAIDEHAFDFTDPPRRTDEILEALDLLRDQIWYNRHKCWIHRVDTGQIKESPEIIRTAKAAARRVQRRRGKKNLGPWDDFEWGMLNGKMSALRWVLGDEWDSLDT